MRIDKKAFVATEYDRDERNKKALRNWLECDFWTEKESLYLFANIDPNKVIPDFDNSPAEFTTLAGVEFVVGRGYYENADGFYEGSGDGERYLNRLTEINEWLNDHFYFAPRIYPRDIIDVAVERRERIPWLHFAIREGLYTPLEARTNKQYFGSAVLGAKERETLQKILGGLVKSVYRINIHANRIERLKEVQDDLNNVGVEIHIDTLRDHVKSGARLIEPITGD